MKKIFLPKKNINIFTNATARLLFVACIAANSLGGFLAIPVQAADSQIYSVQLKNASDASQLRAIDSHARQEFAFSNAPEFSNVYVFNSGLSLNLLQQKLAGEYDYLEPVARMDEADVSLNDPWFTSDSFDSNKQWGLAKAGFISAWNRTTGSTNNIIAVIDTGIDETHEDLHSVTFVQGYDFLAQKDILTGVNSDDNGHGTLIAGVLGATPNNGIGIVGTNWQVSLMPLKVLDASGKGDSAGVSQAIVWAADHGASIINLSLSGIGTGHDTVLANSIAYAFNKGVVIVAAAGNDVSKTGGNLDTNPSYPICDDNNSNMIIGVAATDQNDQKASFSDYGRLCVDVTAPGKHIVSTINRDAVTKAPAPNSYIYASGTSLAVPFVAGQAALLKSLYPQASNAQIRDRILSTADSIDSFNTTQCEGGPCAGLLGAGRINVARSIQAGVITPNVNEGDLILVQEKNTLYHIVGGQKRFVSSFVYNQKFQNAPFKTLPEAALSNLPEGPAEAPTDGTLIKASNSPAVYSILNGTKQPITYQVFLQRNLNFSDVKTVDPVVVASLPVGSFLPPVDGTLLRTSNNPTVYWVVGGVLHPINYGFYMQKGLNIFPVLFVGDTDIQGFVRGEAYIR